MGRCECVFFFRSVSLRLLDLACIHSFIAYHVAWRASLVEDWSAERFEQRWNAIRWPRVLAYRNGQGVEATATVAQVEARRVRAVDCCLVSISEIEHMDEGWKERIC